jgi:hypothetical protein
MSSGSYHPPPSAARAAQCATLRASFGARHSVAGSPDAEKIALFGHFGRRAIPGTHEGGRPKTRAQPLGYASDRPSRAKTHGAETTIRSGIVC